ncbi:MAG: TatD family hydrolase [Atopobiaceae bacterium]|nr:TatD family hydrolase [Atopobiaceae bacterium]MBR1829840.1 TatD family hydrolase [Atopobiaceae bacterium]
MTDSWNCEEALATLLEDDGFLFHDKKGRPVELPQAEAPLADTHGHLTHFRKHDPAVAVARAALAGVHMLVVPLDPTGDAHDAPATLAWLDRVVAQAAELLDAAQKRGIMPPDVTGFEFVPALVDNVRIVAGTHPYGAEAFLGRGKTDRSDAAFGEASHQALEVLLDSPRCVGVGEIGLDFGPYSELGQEVQLDAFEEQLRMAHARNLPVELHLRDEEDGVHTTGHDLALQTLRAIGVPAAGCDLHCYTSGPDIMMPFVDLGCHVAFGGAATFARSEDIRDAAAACPERLLLSETDSPYMAPVPLRGKECEPAMVAFSAACVADVREETGVSTRAETYRALWNNANELLCRR